MKKILLTISLVLILCFTCVFNVKAAGADSIDLDIQYFYVKDVKTVYTVLFNEGNSCELRLHEGGAYSQNNATYKVVNNKIAITKMDNYYLEIEEGNKLIRTNEFAPSYNEIYTYTNPDNSKDFANFKIISDTEMVIELSLDGQKPLAKTVLYAIDENFNYCLVAAGQTMMKFKFNTNGEIIDPIEPNAPVVKDKDFTLEGIVDYIIAFVVSFLGSSAFMGIVKAITNKGIKALKNKVSELEEQNKISAEAKQVYEKKIEELNGTINSYIQKNDETLDLIREKLNVDAEKEKEMAELLEKLLPEVAYETKEENK